MEPKLVREQIEWECRRVAAAFKIEKWNEVFLGEGSDPRYVDFEGHAEGALIEWGYDVSSGKLNGIAVGDTEEQDEFCVVRWISSPDWECVPDPCYDEQMARGLYRLGFENEGVGSQLPPLSAHEKLELRLSMPRGFWPQKWLDEVLELEV